MIRMSSADRMSRRARGVIGNATAGIVVMALALLPALTSTSSHELSEAITDPIPGQGWYDDNNGEIGDICAWKTKQLGSFTIQLEWSNSANNCI